MEKKCVFVETAASPAELCNPIDWSLCVLCQRLTRDKLVCPGRSVGHNTDAGYESLAEILPEFEQFGRLPPHLMTFSNRDKNAFLNAFTTNTAQWHKSCRNNFSKRELERKQSLASKQQEAISPSLPEEHVSDDILPSQKRRCTRSDVDSANALRAEIPLCFFCDLPGDEQSLHAVTTFEVDRRVKDCALVLSDNRLLAKLAVGDMIALEAQYHSQCLVSLYNRRRAFEREQFGHFSKNYNVAHSVAFAQLTSYINEVRAIDCIVPVFKLAELKKMYLSRLHQLDPLALAEQTIHSTRLKEKLLAHFPDMHAQNDGRDVVFAFESNLGTALSRACTSDMDDDALHLARAAEVVRRDMFDSSWQFGGSLHKVDQCKSVPQSLLTLVKMVLEGPAIDVQALEESAQAALTIGQLMVFNSVKHKRSTGSHIGKAVRHSLQQETPVPLYVGLAIHAATRKKRLVDKLFSLGLSVSYDRILTVLSSLASDVCELFENDNALCPLNLKHEVFTTAAVDNIDHNTSSTTSTDSFHGTGISIHQHPDPEMTGIDRSVIRAVHEEVRNKQFALPVSYTYVPLVHLLQKEPAVPVLAGTQQVSNPDFVRCAGSNEGDWLNSVWQNWKADTFVVDSVKSWAAFHAEQSNTQNMSLCSMLPLFHEHAQSVAMIRHAMDIVCASVSVLNTSQVPVIAFDQPLYTLDKLIQWN